MKFPQPNVQVGITQNGTVIKTLAAYWDVEKNDWQAVVDGALETGEVAQACIQALAAIGKLPTKP